MASLRRSGFETSRIQAELSNWDAAMYGAALVEEKPDVDPMLVSTVEQLWTSSETIGLVSPESNSGSSSISLTRNDDTAPEVFNEDLRRFRESRS